MSGPIQQQNENITFPVRLYEVVDQAITAGYESAVSWLPDGRSFKVHDQELFVDRIVPSYFTLTKYKSFLRQLTIYGFRRISKGPHKGGYFHPCFIRGEPSLVYSITRQPCKSKSDGRKIKKCKTKEKTTSIMCLDDVPPKEKPESLPDTTVDVSSLVVMDDCDAKRKQTKVISNFEVQSEVRDNLVSPDVIPLDPTLSDIDFNIQKEIEKIDTMTPHPFLADAAFSEFGNFLSLRKQNPITTSREDWWQKQNHNLWDSVRDTIDIKGEYVTDEVVDEIISTFRIRDFHDTSS